MEAEMEEGAGKAEEVEEAAREYKKMTKHLRRI